MKFSSHFRHQAKSSGFPRAIAISAIVCLFASAWSQALTPSWSTFAWNALASGFGSTGLKNAPVFSPDGKKVLYWSDHQFEVFGLPSGSTLGAALCIQKVNGLSGSATLTSACFTADSTSVLYSTSEGYIYSYNVASRVNTDLKVPFQASVGAKFLKSSADGTRLLYVTQETLGNSKLCLYNLKSAKFLAFFNAGFTANSIDFLGSAKLVTTGPVIFDYTGHATPVASTANVTTVSRDGSTIFGWTGKTAYAFSATSLSQEWSAALPSGTSASFPANLTTDGQALLFSGVSGGAWIVGGLNTATGAPLPSQISFSNGDHPSTLPFAVSPITGQVLLGPGSRTVPQLWSVDSSTGNGASLGAPLAAAWGQMSGYATGVASGRFTWNAAARPIITTDEIQGNGAAETATGRDADTGLLFGVLPSTASVLNPTGAYFATATTGGMTTYTLDGKPTGTAYNGKMVTTSPIFWGGNMIVASENVGFGATSLDIFGFNGKDVTLLHQVDIPRQYQLAPDGAVFANVNQGFGTSINVSDSQSNALLGNLNIQVPDVLQGFCLANGLFAVERTNVVNGAQSHSADIYSTTNGTLTFERTIAYVADPGGATDQNSGHFGIAMTQDGKYLALSHTYDDSTDQPMAKGSIKVFQVSDGSPVNSWDNQFLPDHNLPFTLVFSADDTTLIWPSIGGWVATPVGVRFQSFTLTPTTVGGGSSSSAKISLTGLAPSNGLTATITQSGGQVLKIPTSVSIDPGTASASFSVPTTAVSATTTVSITAAIGSVSKKATLTITPPQLTSLSLRTAVVGGNTTTATVTISAPAGPLGAIVTLAKTGPLTVPASVKVLAGQTTATFVVSSDGVTTSTAATVTATYGMSKTAPITVKAASLSGIIAAAPSIEGGLRDLTTVQLNGLAAGTGYVVNLTVSGPITVPASSITVPAGSRTYAFQATTLPTAVSTAAVITATHSSVSKSVSITVTPPTLLRFALASSSVTGGTTVQATVTLHGKAPSTGTTVAIVASPSTAVTVPTSVKVASGQSVATFTVTTKKVSVITNATVKATLGATSITVKLTINP